MSNLGMNFLRRNITQVNVQKHLSAQHPDGWFGNGIHGCEDMDSHISALLNVGIKPDSPFIQRAVDALTTPEIASQHKNWFIGGEALDAEGRGGNHAIIAQILSWVGYSEDYPIMAEQIALAQEHLFAVFDYTSPDDFSVKMKNYRCYKPNAMLMYGKEASNRKQEIDRQHHTIPNQKKLKTKRQALWKCA